MVVLATERQATVYSGKRTKLRDVYRGVFSLAKYNNNHNYLDSVFSTLNNNDNGN